MDLFGRPVDRQRQKALEVIDARPPGADGCSTIFDIAMMRIASSDGKVSYNTLGMIAGIFEDIAKEYPCGDDFPVDQLKQAAERLRKVLLGA